MTWERDLQAVERAIAAVTAEYDAFLYGSALKPPLESRKKVDRLLRSFAAREPESAADRFRFSTIQGRWAALGDRWEKLQTEKEAGRRPGLYGHFRPTRSDPVSTVREAAAAGEPNAAAARSVEEEDPAASDAHRVLFERYVAARQARGETADGLDFVRFADSLEREANRLKERFGGADVEFDVAERDGRVRLVARKKT